MKIDFLECVNKLVENVEETTGKDVKIFENSNQASMVESKTARTGDDFHLISISPNRTPVMNHIVASKLIQILRTYKCNPQDRVMAVAYQEHINSARMDISPETVSKPHLEIALNDPSLTSTWVLSLINQLISQPVNINIEKVIFNDFPELREFQKSIISNQFRDFNATLKKEIEKISPSIIYETSAIMNYIYLKSMDDLIGSDYIDNLNYIVRAKRSQKLYEYTKDNLMNKFTSDISTINYWAKSLRLTNWFTWVDFENID